MMKVRTEEIILNIGINTTRKSAQGETDTVEQCS